jgi:hypothetical protein
MNWSRKPVSGALEPQLNFLYRKTAVVPAKAGIHVDLMIDRQTDSRSPSSDVERRGNDDGWAFRVSRRDPHG